MVESTCFCRGPRLDSQYSEGGSQMSAIPILGYPPFLFSMGTRQVRGTQTYTQAKHS